MLHYHVADGSIDPDGSQQPFALLALFARCVVAGSIVSVAAWILISALLDPFR
jgi:hypothetical protein